MWEVCPAGLTRRYTKEHEGGTADFADWSRLGAGYRRLDDQGKRKFRRFVQILGVLAHAY